MKQFMPCTYSNSDSMRNDFAYIYYDALRIANVYKGYYC